MCSRILAHWPWRRKRVAARYRASRSAVVQALELRRTIPGSEWEDDEEEVEGLVVQVGAWREEEGAPGTPHGKTRSFSFLGAELGCEEEEEEEVVFRGWTGYSDTKDDVAVVGLGYENTQTKGATMEGRKDGRAAFRTWEHAFEKEWYWDAARISDAPELDRDIWDIWDKLWWLWWRDSGGREDVESSSS